MNETIKLNGRRRKGSEELTNKEYAKYREERKENNTRKEGKIN